MRTIFLVLIFLLLGLVTGFVLARVFFGISTFLLGRKVNNQINKGDKVFYYKQKPYGLKSEIDYEQSKRKAVKSRIFGFLKRKKLKGGISDYGNSVQPGLEQQPVSNSEYGNNQGKETGSPTSPETTNTRTTAENTESNTSSAGSPETRGNPGFSINRNLLEKGKKLN